MNVNTASEIKLMERAGTLAGLTLQHVGKFVKPGVTTDELDKIANDFILSHGAVSGCVGYEGYPKAICTSVNEVICHGLPNSRVLKNQDIINIDVTVLIDGFHGDTSSMFFVGEKTVRGNNLAECALGAMNKGIETATAGATTGDIGFAIDKFVSRKGFFAVKEIGGHGIGRIFHDEPFIPSFGKKGKGTPLLKWGTITIEPMVNETDAPIKEIKIPKSRITEIVTSDGNWSAQYEHTILITDGKAQILTLV